MRITLYFSLKKTKIYNLDSDNQLTRDTEKKMIKLAQKFEYVNIICYVFTTT